MNDPAASPHGAAVALAAEIKRRMPDAERPLVVAIDGRSGSGKSTLAALLAPLVDGVVVPADDFFASEIATSGWEARSAAERAADALDWRRLRTEALEPLRAGRPATWHSFDFGAEARPDGSYSMQAEPIVRLPGPVVILDGAYSARPELADLLDLTVLVEAPEAVRHARLAAREDPQVLVAWHARWDAAEDHYFGTVRPATAFDLIIGGAA
ncbi:MAG TPA: hypothetical protein PK948_05645 [Gemmatimonadales bacterium]|nr:hypothetical protein [Gemmatimonadales bacterium]